MFLLRLASNEQRWITMETRGRWSSFDVSFALSRGGKTNTLTRTKFARPNKIQRFSLEMEYSLDDEYRPILRVPPFSSIFLERKLGVDDICTPDRPRKQREKGVWVINEIPRRLIYVDGTSRRIDRAKLRIIEVRLRNCVETVLAASIESDTVENFPIDSRCSPRSREGGM